MRNLLFDNDYYPGGMLLPNRHGSVDSDSYRYGFQGQERDDEVKGEGNSYNYTYRMHDPRLMRFFATDPLTHEYSELTPYQFSSNRVIDAVEYEGLESYLIHGTLSLEGNPSYNASSYFSDLYKDFAVGRTGSESIYTPSWGGAWNPSSRKKKGRELADLIIRTNEFESGENVFSPITPKPILMLGHSHGGNVGIEAANLVVEHFDTELKAGNITSMPRIDLILINTPVHENYDGELFSHTLSAVAKEHINFIQVDSYMDMVSYGDHIATDFLTQSGNPLIPDEFYNSAWQIEYNDTAFSFYKGEQDLMNYLLLEVGNHLGNTTENAKKIIPKIERTLETVDTWNQIQNSQNNAPTEDQIKTGG